MTAIEILQESLELIVKSDLHRTNHHLYCCLVNRITAAIRKLREEKGLLND